MTYTRIALRIRWQNAAGRTFTRIVDCGHCRADADFGTLALLNVYRSGRVLSWEIV